MLTTSAPPGDLSRRPLRAGMPVALRIDLRFAALALVVLGLALRIAAARGDLWIDEIWTLALVSGLGSPLQVFWRIAHDNNHVLNSLWMCLLGPDSSSLAYRLPAILCGAMSILVAMRIGERSSPIAAVVSGAVVAIGYPLVNYGSEARGYSGLILAVLIAIDAFERAWPLLASPEPDDRRRLGAESLCLGLAAGWGALCHLTMAVAIGILVVTAIVTPALEGRGLRPRELPARLFRLFGPAALLMLPAFAVLSAGILTKHGLTMGEMSRGAGHFLTGYGGLLGATLGFPSAWPPVLPLLAAVVAIGGVWLAGLLSPVRTVLAVTGLVIYPAVVWGADAPNLQFPRYFLVSGVILVLVLSDAASQALERPVARVVAATCLVIVAAGHLALDTRLIADGRGEASRAVAAMAAVPGASYAANFKSAHEYPLDYYGFRNGVTLARIREPLDCAVLPAFYLEESGPDARAAAPSITLGPQACPTTYGRELDLPTSPLSGSHWTLYRHP